MKSAFASLFVLIAIFGCRGFKNPCDPKVDLIKSLPDKFNIEIINENEVKTFIFDLT